MRTIDHNLIEIALERSDGASFEKFAQAFFSLVFGTNFIPLGGVHDGGAEGFIEPGSFETKVEVFFRHPYGQITQSKLRKQSNDFVNLGERQSN